MKVFVLLKQNVSTLPPIISLIDFLREQNREVVLISVGDIPAHWLDDVEHNRIDIKRSNAVEKLFGWWKFRRFSRRIVLRRYEEGDLLWIGSADAFLATGNNTLKGKKSIVQLHELYDKHLFYWYALRLMIRPGQKVVVPEINRAFLLKFHLSLETMPMVVPNSVYSWNNIDCSDTNKLRNEIEGLKDSGKTVLLYQGMLSERRNVLDLAREVSFLSDKVSLVLLGIFENRELETQVLSCEGVHYFGYVPAPKHLCITQCCDIGIMTYVPSSLNNVYCAPNKIWEYTRFGLPIVTNRLPGLLDVDKFGFGSFVSDDFKDLSVALSTILDNFNDYSSNSLDYFKSLDMYKIYSAVIDV